MAETTGKIFEKDIQVLIFLLNFCIIILTVSMNAVTAITMDFTSSEADYMKNCITAIQTVVSMSVDSFNMVC